MLLEVAVDSKRPICSRDTAMLQAIQAHLESMRISISKAPQREVSLIPDYLYGCLWEGYVLLERLPNRVSEVESTSSMYS
jgi:hypothetical protein